MQPLLKENKMTVRTLIKKLAYFAVFAYIVSAISCEMVANTAFISTIAIYLVFAVGVLFVITNDKITLNEYVILFAALCVYVFVMVAAPNASLGNGKRIAYLLFTCAVLCILVFWMSSRLENIIPVAIIAYIVGALILAVRMVDSYGGIVELIEYVSQAGEYRAGKLLGNENAIGLFFSTGILCSLLIFIRSKKLWVKLFMLVSIIALGVPMLFTGSRKALVFAVLGIILLVIFGYKGARIGKRFVSLMTLFVVMAAIYVAITTLPMFATINDRFELLFDGFFADNVSYKTDEMRKLMISRGLEAFVEKPLFGHGTGYSYVLFGTYSHNNLVELLMNYGLVGFCLYYGLYLVLIVKLLKQAMKNDIYAVFFFVYVCVQVALGVGWVNYYERPVQIMTALAAGYLVSLEINKRGGLGKNEAKKSV